MPRNFAGRGAVQLLRGVFYPGFEFLIRSIPVALIFEPLPELSICSYSATQNLSELMYFEDYSVRSYA